VSGLLRCQVAGPPAGDHAGGPALVALGASCMATAPLLPKLRVAVTLLLAVTQHGGAAVAPSPPSPPAPLRFQHSWDTLPVFWFSANASGPESASEMALISNYSAAVLSWELGTQGTKDPWRHTDAKMKALAAKLSTAAPKTEVIMYMQGQLAMDWYEITRALLPPPCGTDSSGAFADFWLLDNATHAPAAWPSPHGSICRSLNGSDLQ
jgi:hypothetical protein